ncbi:hypothetical protein AAL_03232 [Moelleriella libera RCEF 2490]|uniref:Uncharacterized protein n=1 Tax=Moelleriella libera RCEF 2490 TaxID=1081109 RepID=A0A168EEG3_9HYPO|nr:hypothetical protein AAL_03232 [Moelleriella libera RCEF 2490]
MSCRVSRRKRVSRKRGSRIRDSPYSVEEGDEGNTTTTKSTSPYDSNFQQHLINNRIYPPRYAYPDGSRPQPPDNMDEIKRALECHRSSLSPSVFSDGAFDSFQDADTHAAKEAQVMARVIPIIEGKLEDPKCTAGQIQFNNLDHLTDGSLVAGNPDVYYGARPEQLQQELRKHVSGQVEPSTQDHLPVAPNFFLQVKGPDGSLSVATRQACYDGTLGARGIRSLQSYGQSELPCDNKAYTLTSTYHGGQLKMYTVHPLPKYTLGENPGFAMTQVKTWALTGDADTFRQGVRAYRNGRDWAKRQRDDAINRANKRKAETEDGPSSVSESLGFSATSWASAVAETTVTGKESRTNIVSSLSSYESETSADELSHVDKQPN